MADAPVLWHIAVSHYSEKVRWALDHKAVEHERKAPPPGAHVGVALALTRGRAATFPVLQLDGRAIGDSTAILAALEERFADRPLLPADPDERARALALEEHFDEQVGPFTRRLAFHELRQDREALGAFAADTLPGPLRGQPAARAVVGRFALAFTAGRYGAASAEKAEHARAQIRAGFDRLEAELDRAGGDHLAGDAFSVADLTAAALLGPVVRPPEGPALPPVPEPFLAFCRTQENRPGFRWVAETFARHRRGARRP